MKEKFVSPESRRVATKIAVRIMRVSTGVAPEKSQWARDF